MLLRLLPLALLAALLPACEPDDEGSDPNNIDCTTATVPKFSEMTAWAKCTTCHSSTVTGADRQAAPPGIDFDKVDTARTWASTAMSEVEEGSMPLAGSPDLTEAEKTQIYTWASCDTPN